MLISSPFGEFKGLVTERSGFTHRHRNLQSAADQGFTWAALTRSLHASRRSGGCLSWVPSGSARSRSPQGRVVLPRVKHTPTAARPGVPRCSAETFAGSCSTPCLVLYRGRSLVI